MDSTEVAAELDKPLAGQLLRGSPLMRLAYVGLDGTPRVIPIAYLWKDRRIVVCTVPTSGKVKALRQNPAVAVTIDYDGQPTRALLLRGVASIEVLDGVPREYLAASLKTQSARGAEDFESAVRALYDSMARITITPTWARLNDFETTMPKDTERIARQTGFID
ncbi:pyridoxamine 5'-phosphate oxidase family protein [Solicola gregarius]|uniref:Pyridoxamine 5'-phosphate oxidase family protein n=1 Tax=Solicola gregarius TaxID=2908642 RepID=A0AA46TE54_9ACTN|nr:pyridoxamine 5'-phosphate oxidase family protein [Solicola gregarius]UYM03455.1 pyridoxamine 5'-phosphate oxidase family protein [Solicola gregarius]